jgi:hypothetical protein
MRRSFLFICIMCCPLLSGKVEEFNHRVHFEEEELECIDCHEAVLKADDLQNMILYSLESCNDCHDEPGYDTSYTFTVSDTGFPMPFSFRPGCLKLSHRIHHEQEVACRDCHGDWKAKNVKAEDWQNMRSCMECHEKKADISCLACHFERLMPDFHTAQHWIKREGHGLESCFRSRDCELCHGKNNTCTECHMGADGRRIHEPEYREMHGMDVLFKTSDCSVCHQPLRIFCDECHIQFGISTY